MFNLSFISKRTPLFSQFENGIDALVAEIKHQAPALVPAPARDYSTATTGGYSDQRSIEAWGDDVDDDVFSLNEMRAELDRLRQASSGNDTGSGGGGGGGSGSSTSSFSNNNNRVTLKCAIPAAVPDNPTWQV